MSAIFFTSITAPPTTGPRLDFSKASNSMYIAVVMGFA